MRLPARLRNRWSVARRAGARRAEAKTPPSPLSDSFRWPALEPERRPGPAGGSGSGGSMNGATALGIQAAHHPSQISSGY